MPINPVSLTSESVYENTESVVEVRYTQPPLPETLLDPPETPNKLIAYYDGAADSASLYIVSRSGLRLLPM
jgi:hypothetical protein